MKYQSVLEGVKAMERICYSGRMSKERVDILDTLGRIRRFMRMPYIISLLVSVVAVLIPACVVLLAAPELLKGSYSVLDVLDVYVCLGVSMGGLFVAFFIILYVMLFLTNLAFRFLARREIKKLEEATSRDSELHAVFLAHFGQAKKPGRRRLRPVSA